MKRQLRKWEKIFKNYVSSKDPVSMIYRNLITQQKKSQDGYNKRQQIINDGEDTEKLEPSYISGHVKWYSCLESLSLLKKLNLVLPCDPAFPLIRIYAIELKIYFHTKPYMEV